MATTMTRGTPSNRKICAEEKSVHILKLKSRSKRRSSGRIVQERQDLTIFVTVT